MATAASVRVFIFSSYLSSPLPLSVVAAVPCVNVLSPPTELTLPFYGESIQFRYTLNFRLGEALCWHNGVSDFQAGYRVLRNPCDFPKLFADRDGAGHLNELRCRLLHGEDIQRHHGDRIIGAEPKNVELLDPFLKPTKLADGWWHFHRRFYRFNRYRAVSVNLAATPHQQRT